jgi:hypothetical protein
MNAPSIKRLAATLVPLVFFASCQIPRANLANLHEVHTPSGQISYRGRVQNDLEYALARSFQGGVIGIKGLANLGGGEQTIKDPLRACLENQLELAEADSSDPLIAGLQVEAFGWLAVDDQYSLGRERAMLELGRHASRLEVSGPKIPPENAATPEVLSPLLAGLAKAGLGALPAAVSALNAELNSGDTPNTLGEAITGILELSLDRNGALRVLAVCDVLRERGDNLENSDGQTLRRLGELQRAMQVIIIEQAFGSGMSDPSPEVRIATLAGMANLPKGPPDTLLLLFATDPAPKVVAASLSFIERNGIPMPAEDLSSDDAKLYREEWVSFLVGQCQSPEGVISVKACAALGAVSQAGFRSLRAEDWTTWWRSENEDKRMPQPAMRTVVSTNF